MTDRVEVTRGDRRTAFEIARFFLGNDASLPDEFLSGECERHFVLDVIAAHRTRTAEECGKSVPPPRDEADRIIREAARLLLDPGDGAVTFALRIEGDRTTLQTRAGKNVDPRKAVETAIETFRAELEAIANCPAHAALSTPQEQENGR